VGSVVQRLRLGTDVKGQDFGYYFGIPAGKLGIYHNLVSGMQTTGSFALRFEFRILLYDWSQQVGDTLATHVLDHECVKYPFQDRDRQSHVAAELADGSAGTFGLRFLYQQDGSSLQCRCGDAVWLG